MNWIFPKNVWLVFIGKIIRNFCLESKLPSNIKNLSKKGNFVQKYKFCSKIQILFRNTNFVQRYNFCSEIQILFKNTNFVQQYKLCSKIQMFAENLKKSYQSEKNNFFWKKNSQKKYITKKVIRILKKKIIFQPQINKILKKATLPDMKDWQIKTSTKIWTKLDVLRKIKKNSQFYIFPDGRKDVVAC